MLVNGQSQVWGVQIRFGSWGGQGSDTHTSGCEAVSILEISTESISQRSPICVEEAVCESQSTPQFVGPPARAQTRCTTIGAQSLQLARAGFLSTMADRDWAGGFELLMRRVDVTEQGCAGRPFCA